MSIKQELYGDPILRNWMEWPIQSEKFDHHVTIKFAAIRIAIGRHLNKLTV